MAGYDKKTGDMTAAQVNYGWGLSLSMTGKAPAIAKRIFKTLENARVYASDVKDSAIEGLILTVTGDNANNGAYIIKKAGVDCELVKLGEATSAESNLQAEAEARIAQDDKIEGSVGLNVDGSHKASGGNYTNGASTVVGEIAALDRELKITNDAIAEMDYTATANDGSYIDGFTQLNGNITAHTTKPFDTSLNSTSKKAPQTKAVDAAIKAVKVTAEGDNYVNAQVSDDAGRKVSVSANVETNIANATSGTKLADANGVKTYVDAVKVTAEGDTYINAEVKDSNGRKVSVSATTSLTNALSNAKTTINTNVEGESASHMTIGKTTGNVGTPDSYKFTLTDVASQDALEAEISARKAVDGQTGQEYVPNNAESVKYINEANSLNDADVKLDAAIAKEVTDRGTAITNLVDGASIGYNTLKGLEGKIKDETEARTNAINGLKSSDTESVGKYVSKVNQANGVVTASKKVDLIASGDKVLSLKGGSVQSTIALKEVTTGLGANVAKQYQLVGIDNAKLGDVAIDIPKDTTLKNAEFVLKKPTSEEDYGKPEKEWTGGTTKGQFLKLTYIISDEGSTGGTKEKIVYVDMSQLVHESEVGNGVQNQNGKLSIKIDTSSEKFLTTGGQGLKLSGVQDAIDNAKAAATTTVVKDETDDNTNKHLDITSTENGHKEYKLKLKDVASAQELANDKAALTTETSERQAQDDKIEASVGLTNAGDKPTFAGTYLKGQKTIVEAINQLDNALGQTDVKIAAMDLEQVGADGSFIKLVSQADGKISATADTFDTELNGASTKAPQTKAVNTAITNLIGGATEGYQTLKQIEEKVKTKAETSSLNAEITARKNVTGIQGDKCSYSGTNYLNGITTLHAADIKLDTQIKDNANAISLETSNRNIAVEGAKTYADELLVWHEEN